MAQLCSTFVVVVCFATAVYCQGTGSQSLRADIDSIVREITGTSVTAAVRNDNAFRVSDERQDQIQSTRPLFGSSRETTAANRAGLLIEEQAIRLSQRIAGLEGAPGPADGADAAGAPGAPGVLGAPGIFAGADGAPQNQVVAEIVVRVGEMASCVFDKNNTDPCNSKYREHSGRCSHLEEGQRTLGMARTPYPRILPNKYVDEIREIRTTEFTAPFKPLKSAREISETVTDTLRILHRDYSSMVMQWGQFIAHDVTLLAEEEEHIECCPDKIFSDRNGANVRPTKKQLDDIRKEIQDSRGDVCIAIEREFDPIYGGYVCMSLTRSLVTPNHNCSIGPRKQSNQNTHMVDGSAVYGSSKEDADKLRSFRDGKMKVQQVNGYTLPPADMADCPAASVGRCPLMGGDIRIFETPNLASMHTAFLIIHNKFAEELKGINPHWNDETIYQETRRIIAGIESNIQFHEFLPIIIGRNLHRRYFGRYTGYDSSINPSVLNEMAAAAHRFGHSIVEGDFVTIDTRGRRTMHDLEQHFFSSNNVYDFGPNAHLRGVHDTRSRKVDEHFPRQMRDRLFKENRDIISLNIKRGRDHGFDSYVNYRRNYRLSVPNSWASLRRTHSSRVVRDLRKVYTSVGDIELFIGAVTEKPAPGALLGPTFAHIMADGYKRLRDGDRLYYESSESGLTRAQLNEINRFYLAQLLCIGADLDTVSEKAFYHTDSYHSRRVRCTSFPKFNLSLWRENGSNNNKCYWRNVSVSNCCQGRKTISRECVNQSRRCKCRGRRVTSRRCSCSPHDYVCLVQSLTCHL